MNFKEFSTNTFNGDLSLEEPGNVVEPQSAPSHVPFGLANKIVYTSNYEHDAVPTYPNAAATRSGIEYFCF